MPVGAAIIPTMEDTEGHPPAPFDAQDLAIEALRAFVRDAIATATTTGQSPDAHRRHVPIFDLEYDAQFTQLASYAQAVARVSQIGNFRQHYGVEEAERIVLQFLYEYFSEAPSLLVHDACFESVGSRFFQELSKPAWRHVAIAILQNFTSPLHRIEIADGIAVCLRTLEDTRGAVGREELRWLEEDWMRGAIGSHALIAEHSEPKTPGNVISGDANHTFKKIERALLALRLAKAGDVRTGRIFYCRPALLPKRLPGRPSSGEAEFRPGADYLLEDCDAPLVRRSYALLAQFDNIAATWNKIRVAIRRFTAIYENDWREPEDRVIDAMIAVEWLLRTKNARELSLRVAGLLADDDVEREALKKETKRWCRLRGNIVHGADSRPQDREALATTGEFINIVRRVLLGFLTLATGSSRFNDRPSLSADIDKLLLDTSERSELRKAMGLCE
jgi:hypothetical protein